MSKPKVKSRIRMRPSVQESASAAINESSTTTSQKPPHKLSEPKAKRRADRIGLPPSVIKEIKEPNIIPSLNGNLKELKAPSEAKVKRRIGGGGVSGASGVSTNSSIPTPTVTDSSLDSFLKRFKVEKIGEGSYVESPYKMSEQKVKSRIGIGVSAATTKTETTSDKPQLTQVESHKISEQKAKARVAINMPIVVDSSLDSFLKRFKIVEKIGEGSYSEVLKCKNKESGVLVACKRLKHTYRNWSQVNEMAEVKTLRTLQRHPNILQMLEIHYDVKLGKVSIIFEIMDMNLYELIKDRKRLLSESTVRVYMLQLMRALKHLHKHGVFHRDIKPENILIRSRTNILKLGDLGSARGLHSRPPFTHYISTRWYRSPECLLTAGHYGFKMDIWAAGCVFYEILTLKPLFPGSSELDQINRIHNIMGPPPQKVLQKFHEQAQLDKSLYRNRSQQTRWDGMRKVIDEYRTKFEQSGSTNSNFDWYFFGGKNSGGLERKIPSYVSTAARELCQTMLTYDPETRPTAQRVLHHHYFNDVRYFSMADIASKLRVKN